VFLGHMVGQGEVAPVASKVDAILNFPVPTDNREVMRFLGMAGYYCKFCYNFSTVAEPLTSLLQKQRKCGVKIATTFLRKLNRCYCQHLC